MICAVARLRLESDTVKDFLKGVDSNAEACEKAATDEDIVSVVQGDKEKAVLESMPAEDPDDIPDISCEETLGNWSCSYYATYVARLVYVFKVLPRCYHAEDTDAGRKAHKQRLLNRKVTATLKRLPRVRILNAEHRFLDAAKRPRRNFFAYDGYHVHRCQGINQLSKILVSSLVRDFGQEIKSSAHSEPGSRYRVLNCCHCTTKGHKSFECFSFRGLSHQVSRPH
ncbi:hypothetical protein HPB50_027967 [Hyalomma asiaticum]|nr:hypothetical protein HPB50_027967 [Hyalomma asiaticum]